LFLEVQTKIGSADEQVLIKTKFVDENYYKFEKKWASEELSYCVFYFAELNKLPVVLYQWNDIRKNSKFLFGIIKNWNEL